MKESDIQREVYSRFKDNYPLYIRSFQASLNGVNLGRFRFAIINALKAQGMCIGQSDIFIAVPRAGYHGKFIELKTDLRNATEEQLKFGDAMIRQGYAFEVAKGLDAAWSAIESYMDCQEEP